MAKRRAAMSSMPAFAEPPGRVDDRVAAVEAHITGLDAPAIGFDHGRARHDHQARVRKGVAVLQQLPAARLASGAQDSNASSQSKGMARLRRAARNAHRHATVSFGAAPRRRYSKTALS